MTHQQIIFPKHQTHFRSIRVVGVLKDLREPLQSVARQKLAAASRTVQRLSDDPWEPGKSFSKSQHRCACCGPVLRFVDVLAARMVVVK